MTEQAYVPRLAVASDLTMGDLARALKAGWRDFLAYPLFGLFFAALWWRMLRAEATALARPRVFSAAPETCVAPACISPAAVDRPWIAWPTSRSSRSASACIVARRSASARARTP